MSLLSITRTLVLAWTLSLSTSEVYSFGTCRQDPTATSLFCGLPYILSNFQGERIGSAMIVTVLLYVTGGI